MAKTNSAENRPSRQKTRASRLEGTLSEERVAADMARSDVIFSLITAFKSIREIPEDEYVSCARGFLLSAKIAHHPSAAVSHAVRSLRIRAGLSIGDVAHSFDLDHSDVEKLEGGDYGLVSGSAIERIASYLIERTIGNAMLSERDIDVDFAVSSAVVKSLLELPVDVEVTKRFIKDAAAELGET